MGDDGSHLWLRSSGDWPYRKNCPSGCGQTTEIYSAYLHDVTFARD
jgi:hypothetical protein